MTTIDATLGDRVRLRVIDAHPEEFRSVLRQTGWSAAGPARGTADVVLRYVDRLDTAGPLLLVGPSIGCRDDCVVLPPQAAAGPRTLVRLGGLGAADGPVELVREHGPGHVPLLVELLNLAASTRGLLPLHAGAVVLAGKGIVFTGWSKGGKTESVLGMMASTDARFVADEWLYLDPEDQTVFGSAHPLRLWHWHLEQLPDVQARVASREVRRFRVIGQLREAHRRMPARWKTTPPGKLLAAVLPVLEGRAGVHVVPSEIFGAERVLRTTTLDLIVHVEGWTSPETTIEDIAPQDVATRMLVSLRRERQELLEAYEALRYTAPGTASPWLDGAEEQERLLVRRAFGSTPALSVRHPYPVDIRDLAGRLLIALEPTSR